ncbi:class I SAM-dependent methyltransferase [Neptunomonas antarctica]|uniref:23S rRNA (Cytosine1962-C5)-methyltransferase n=1 Tax=Neptunomonas antarctica TaxID=619304 RepID=A0A1N7KD26_9GAMM|nr:class I SAM-dependent methyltransferase [Neptunomonas antarctica]SIS59516.1 23S rRNA (cytosine1962-C5)-methyltransferase [Neptunomonas antarctica]
MTDIYRWIHEQQKIAGNQCRRLLHGRGGFFPGYESVVIDWFSPVVIIRLYADVPEETLSQLKAFFANDSRVTGLLVQHRGRGRETQHEAIFGEVPELLIANESSLKYEIRPAQFQNSGLFLDMRHGRDWVRRHSHGKSVLNLFSFTCAFSVAAMAGGAERVVNVDMSKRGLSIGRANHQLNQHDLSAVTFMPYDMLRSWGRIKRPGPYDVIIIDPPSFQPGSFIAENDYRKVLRRLPELAAPQALVLACHNDPAHDQSFVRNLMHEECPQFGFIELIVAQNDFPELEPECGVKAMVFQHNE